MFDMTRRTKKRIRSVGRVTTGHVTIDERTKNEERREFREQKDYAYFQQGKNSIE